MSRRSPVAPHSSIQRSKGQLSEVGLGNGGNAHHRLTEDTGTTSAFTSAGTRENDAEADGAESLFQEASPEWFRPHLFVLAVHPASVGQRLTRRFLEFSCTSIPDSVQPAMLAARSWAAHVDRNEDFGRSPPGGQRGPSWRSLHPTLHSVGDVSCVVIDVTRYSQIFCT